MIVGTVRTLDKQGQVSQYGFHSIDFLINSKRRLIIELLRGRLFICLFFREVSVSSTALQGEIRELSLQPVSSYILSSASSPSCLVAIGLEGGGSADYSLCQLFPCLFFFFPGNSKVEDWLFPKLVYKGSIEGLLPKLVPLWTREDEVIRASNQISFLFYLSIASYSFSMIKLFKCVSLSLRGIAQLSVLCISLSVHHCNTC